MENPLPGRRNKEDLKKMYMSELTDKFLRALVLLKLPEEDQEIVDFRKRRSEIEKEYFPYFISYVAGVTGFHIGVLNRYVGKGLVLSKIFYYTANVFFFNGMIQHFVYGEHLKPYTEALSLKYEAELMELYPYLRTYKSNYRIEDKDFKD